MKVCVLSGSPKGEYSITLQTVRYLSKKYPHDQFRVIHVGKRLPALERDASKELAMMEGADLLLFCYPVYTFLVPYQLHRFIELVKASGVDLTGKAGAQITTSKHFYDVTAHGFIQENCEDLGLAYLGGFSADMDDLLSEKGQREAEAFWDLIHFRARQGLSLPRLSRHPAPQGPYLPLGVETEKRPGHEVVIVAALEPEDHQLSAMIADFQARWPHPSRVVNLFDFPFRGGCLSCFHCATDGTCVYKDGFDSFLREEIQTADAILYAFTVKDHSMGARMKLYDDRQFCNGHRTVTSGMPMGYLIRGDLGAEENLRTVIRGRADVGGNFLAGTATDADGVEALCKTLEYALDAALTQPPTFLGVGGMKIFRDLIYVMQGMMKADHRFYKEHGLYDDLPQRQKGTILKMKLVGGLLSNPKVKAKIGSQMNEGMIAPYRKVLDALDK